MIKKVIDAREYPVNLITVSDYAKIDLDQPQLQNEVHLLIEAFTDKFERYTGRSFITSTYTNTVDCFSDLRMPFGPVQTIESITFIDKDNVEQTIPPEHYRLIRAELVGEVLFNESVPTDVRDCESITVRYVAGMADDAEQVPDSIRLALSMAIVTAYENRGDDKVTEIPPLVKNILDSFRPIQL